MSRSGNAPVEERMELDVSDPAQLPPLRDWMRHQPDLWVTLKSGIPNAGELGAVDVLSVVATSSGLVAAIRTLPDFIRSRRSGLRIEATVRGKRITLDATNVDEVLPLLERLLDD
jgi:Effector Associated Constant Component 1